MKERYFFEEERKAFDAISAIPEQLVISSALIKLGVFHDQLRARESAEIWGLPIVSAVPFSGGELLFFDKKTVLDTLGCSEFVTCGMCRVEILLKCHRGPKLVGHLEKNMIAFKLFKSQPSGAGAIFVNRESARRFVERKAAQALPLAQPQPQPQPQPSKGTDRPATFGDVCQHCDVIVTTILEASRRNDEQHRILLKELQTTRIAVDLLLKEWRSTEGN